MVYKGQFQERQHPEQGRAVRGNDVHGGEQVIKGVIFRFPFPADQQAPCQKPFHAVLPGTAYDIFLYR